MIGFLKRLFGIASAAPRPSEKPRMGYMPYIKSADPIAKYRVGGRDAVLLGNIISAGMVQYLYILVVYDSDGEPCLFVASEVNAFYGDDDGGGSHFLGVFPGDGHMNMGDSDEWADRERFVKRALEIAARPPTF